MSEYYAILTNDGMNEILESISGAREFDAATVAVGDSNGSYYEPTKDQTALKNLKYEGEPFKKGKRDNYLYFDLQIPASEGDYTIREAGVYSSGGKLLIAAKYPESTKTAADSASEKVLNIEIQIQLSDTIINTITIDESGNLATLDDLENKADRDLLNLTKTGQSQYNIFCINTGVADDSGEPAFMTYSNGVLTTSGEFYCTLANGAIYKVEDSLTLDVSDYEDGTYNIFIDPVNLEIAALANSVYIDTVMPDNASDGDILLNISKLPYTLEMQGADNAPTYAYAGTLTVSGGGGELMLKKYNHDYILTKETCFLNKTRLTNCILQAPKPPDLSITDGVLTLKAGVEVIVPYGTSAPELSIGDSLNGGTIVDISWDESKLFYIVRYDEDKTDKVAYTCSNLYLFSGTGANLFEYDSSYITSGSTAPAVFTSAGYAMWYDTDENYVKITTDNGSNWTAGVSFPIGRASSEAGSGYTNILETFSASGFIDKTVWVNKEVTFLLSNGRNDDGTLKNTEYTTGQIYTDTITSSTNNNHTFTFTLNEEYPIIRDPIYYEQTKIPDTGADCLWYNPETNIFMTYRTNTTTGWFQETAAIFAAAGYDTTNQRYLTAKLKNTFQAADNNDIDGRWVMSHLTLIESGAISGSTIYTYDLTDYLPDDYNIYEVMLSSGATTGTTTGNVINLYVQSDIITYDVCIGRTKCISSTASPVGGSITIPIGQFRTLYIKNTSANAGTNFFANLIAYRKVR